MNKLNCIEKFQISNIVKVSRLGKTILMMMALSSGIITFTACGDDETAPVIISVKDVEGNYTGEVEISMLEVTPTSEEGETPSEGIIVEAKVEKDTIYFDKFPTDELITLIVGEENAAGIIEKIGKISYKVGFKPVLNSDYTQIEMALDPKPLIIEIPGVPVEGEIEPTVQKVEVTVATSEKGVFAYEGQTLKYELMVTKVTLDGTPLPLNSVVLNFDMVKK